MTDQFSTWPDFLEAVRQSAEERSSRDESMVETFSKSNLLRDLFVQAQNERTARKKADHANNT